MKFAGLRLRWFKSGARMTQNAQNGLQWDAIRKPRIKSLSQPPLDLKSLQFPSQTTHDSRWHAWLVRKVFKWLWNYLFEKLSYIKMQPPMVRLLNRARDEWMEQYRWNERKKSLRKLRGEKFVIFLTSHVFVSVSALWLSNFQMVPQACEKKWRKKNSNNKGKKGTPWINLISLCWLTFWRSDKNMRNRKLSWNLFDRSTVFLLSSGATPWKTLGRESCHTRVSH